MKANESLPVDAGEIAREAIGAVLESIEVPALLVAEDGHVVRANAGALAILDHDPAAVAGGGVGAGIRRTSLEVAALPGHALVVLASADDPRARLAEATRRWHVTHRQGEVLALLAEGRANKDIAAALGCAEATVELHVTALLEKSGAACRAELVWRFWTGHG